MAVHHLKVVQPYYDALVDGRKTFEVRKNDRAYQRGDILHLWEFEQTPYCHKDHLDDDGRRNCPNYSGQTVTKLVSFVYSGDPRFGGIEPGFVVLALEAVLT